jgi:hypothetical protein
LQKYHLALSKHTAQQLMMASSTLHKGDSQSVASLKKSLVNDRCVQLLGWRTVFQSLLLAGDDGSTVLDICENMTAEELVNERQASQSPVVAAAYNIMRVTDVVLSERLLKVRKLLSRLSLSQVCSQFQHS